MVTKEYHHWYGHVQDVNYINLVWYILAIPLLILLLAFILATGLWGIGILIWLFWK